MTGEPTDLPGWARDELTRLSRERDALRAELTACREDRDRLTLRLVDAEGAVAAVRSKEAQRSAALAASVRRAAASARRQEEAESRAAESLRLAESRAAELARTAERLRAAECMADRLALELAATRRTLSWRVTRPLRAVRRRTRRV